VIFHYLLDTLREAFKKLALPADPVVAS